MTKNEFIKKWNVAYESKEQQNEFNNEMLNDLDSIDERLNLILELQSVSKNSAIGFAEWLSENEWVKRTHTHPNKVGQYYSHKHCEYKTIEQLFDMFSGVA